MYSYEDRIRAVPIASTEGNACVLHVRGALNNGCSKEEIVEVILQIAIYCGVPAAIDAMRITREVLNVEAHT